MPTHEWITPHDLHYRIIDRDQVEREVRAFMTDMLSDLDPTERLGMLAVLRDAWTETTGTTEGQAISDARAEGISWLDVAAYLDVAEATARRTFTLHGQDQPSRSPAVAEPGYEWVRVPGCCSPGSSEPDRIVVFDQDCITKRGHGLHRKEVRAPRSEDRQGVVRRTAGRRR